MITVAGVISSGSELRLTVRGGRMTRFFGAYWTGVEKRLVDSRGTRDGFFVTA
ncbi:hypothetical protein AB0K34_10155 [Actinomadura sp. NPDC049382]|uniref:hypothetical protein n=1 Tax=Actinomadura sp. NPDC049382 TaxID=3158220 RepID=UPI0034205025